jgi:hypothetical protein
MPFTPEREIFKSLGLRGEAPLMFIENQSSSLNLFSGFKFSLLNEG